MSTHGQNLFLRGVVSVSIIAGDLSDLQSMLHTFEDLKVRSIHLDVMDGMFVPNITFGPGLIKAMRPHSRAFFDCHLMIEEPIRYISAFVESGVDSLTIHPGACKDALATLQEITKRGVKCGIAISPNVLVNEVVEYLGLVDHVLVMSVEPGFSGQKFLPSALIKLEQLKEIRSERSYSIGIDGGIDDSNIEAVIKAGADYVVSASYIFKDLGNNLKYLENKFLI